MLEPASGLGYYAIWPCFALLALLLALCATPLFAIADTPPNPRGIRVSNIDGLRGFLALGVFFHHAAVYHQYLQGTWALPPSRFYTVIGLGAVEVFFMITGYLFWVKLLTERGRPDWIKLYIGRIFRIGPLYLVAVSVMLVLVGMRTGWTLHVPVHDFAIQLARWLALGWCGTGPDVNGLEHTGLLLAGTPWTLAFEWKFYLCLLPLAFLARSAKLHLPVVAVASAVCLLAIALRDPAHPSVYLTSATLFLVGMLSAALESHKLMPRLPDFVSSGLVLLLACVFAISGLPVNAAGAIVILGGIFFLIVCGANIFGLLLMRPVRRIGNISYGIYLLQGLVLAIFFAFPLTRNSALASPLEHWAAVLMCAVWLVVFATVMHAVVERPGIEAGRRIGAATVAFTKNRCARTAVGAAR
jgi:peptidoglycan/LPS O-acetylase OafA/YrhL